jgi:hypothetical protein
MNIMGEKLVPLGEAGGYVPLRPHYSTLKRWAYEGINGVVLETLKIGRRRFTSLQALERFVERLNGASDQREQLGQSHQCGFGPGRASDGVTAIEEIN